MRAAPGSQMLEATLQRRCAEAGGELRDVCLHALAGGGRSRAYLLLRAAEREGGEQENGAAVQAACSVEMMHAATLLQDDIFDQGAQRRGRRAAYLEFGEAKAVLASDWLLLRSLELAAEVDPVIFQQLACAARTMTATVAQELAPPALSGVAAARGYIAAICAGKTGCLFAVSLQAAARLQNGFGCEADGPAWGAVGTRLGCTYQLLDDCLDVYAAPGALNKSTGGDLAQGRLTLPLLAALAVAVPEVSLQHFVNACLTRREVELLQRAATEDAVRISLQAELAEEMRLLEESAWRAGVPCRAIAPPLRELRAKMALCFGDAIGEDAGRVLQARGV